MKVLANELSRKSYRRAGDGMAVNPVVADVVGALAETVDDAEVELVVGPGLTATSASAAKGGADPCTFGGRDCFAFDWECDVDFDRDDDLGADFERPARGVNQRSPASGSVGRSSDNESNDELPVDINHHWRKGGPETGGRNVANRIGRAYLFRRSHVGRRRAATNVLVIVAKRVLAGK